MTQTGSVNLLHTLKIRSATMCEIFIKAWSKASEAWNGHFRGTELHQWLHHPFPEPRSTTNVLGNTEPVSRGAMTRSIHVKPHLPFGHHLPLPGSWTRPRSRACSRGSSSEGLLVNDGLLKQQAERRRSNTSSAALLSPGSKAWKTMTLQVPDTVLHTWKPEGRAHGKEGAWWKL